MQDLLIARKLPSCDRLDRDESIPADRVSSTAPLEQLQAISAKNDELAREIENTKLQLVFERRRREQVEEEVHILCSLHLQGRPQHHPTGKGGTLRVHSQHHEAVPASSPCHGANPTVDLPWAKPADHHPRARNVIEPKPPPGRHAIPLVGALPALPTEGSLPACRVPEDRTHRRAARSCPASPPMFPSPASSRWWWF